jgi:hypothetical protein
MFGYNLIYIFRFYEAVPDSVRVDHDRGAVFALVEASGLIGPDSRLQTRIFDLVLEKGM